MSNRDTQQWVLGKPSQKARHYDFFVVPLSNGTTRGQEVMSLGLNLESLGYYTHERLWGLATDIDHLSTATKHQVALHQLQFLLKRDLDPMSKDDTPAWIAKTVWHPSDCPCVDRG
jgi:hypothetical protein